MGKAARRAMLERTTPGERFDIGLEMAEEAIQILLSRAEIPEGAEGDERARHLFRYLRRQGG